MRTVQVNQNLILREDGKLFKIKTGEEFIPILNSGYYRIAMGGRKNRKTKYVHVLVMEYFGPPKPGNDFEVDHINRIRTDNRIENLRWVTRNQNANNKNNNLPEGERKSQLSYRQYMTNAHRKWRKKKKEGI